MIRQTPPWSAVEAFMTAARRDSFKVAADELGLSASAFTRRIQTLEHHVGVTLFERDMQGVRLTPAGRHYQQLLQPGFESLRYAMQAMSPDARLRPLRLRISHSLAANWLVPRLAQFHAKYPDIDLQLQSRGRPDQLAEGMADVGIFFSREPLAGLATRELFTVEAFVVAAPALVPTSLASLDELARYPLLDLTDPGEIWPEWLGLAGCGEAISPACLFDSIEVMYRAASAGLGVALGMRPIVEPFLADGRLHEVLPHRQSIAGAYYVAATKDALRHAAARKLWRWIGDEGAASAATLNG